jgi:hypothetical protein
MKPPTDRPPPERCIRAGAEAAHLNGYFGWYAHCRGCGSQGWGITVERALAAIRHREPGPALPAEADHDLELWERELQ